jgi:hypothetical protein
MSAGNKREWICVDLGSASSFDRIKLFWINKAESGSVQVSNDNENWKDVAALPGSASKIDDIPVESGKGRYVRVLMEKPFSGKNYVLRELEVYGTGGMVTRPKAPLQPDKDRLLLSGGNWKFREL